MEMNRREFLSAALALSAAPLVPAIAATPEPFALESWGRRKTRFDDNWITFRDMQCTRIEAQFGPTGIIYTIDFMSPSQGQMRHAGKIQLTNTDNPFEIGEFYTIEQSFNRGF